MRIAPYILTGLVILVAAEAGHAQDRFQSSFPLVVERFSQSDDGTTLQLKSSFILPGSDTLETMGRVLSRGMEYEIDYRVGVIRLSAGLSTGDTLVVRYRSQPLGLQPRYQFMTLRPWQARSDSIVAQLPGSPGSRQTPLPDPFAESQLRRSGSISRSVSVGSNQSLRLDSGLRLQMDGRITSDVEVTAALTDQNIPIQPEGNTQTLQEIDKVYIQVRGPSAQVQLGDFNLNYRGGRFSGYQRKLQGAMLSLSRGGLTGTISGAVSKGKFRTQRFTGEEGLQGPYQLKGENGISEIIILAGTERVWVDGEVMVRGEENDYVIEYGNGQLTFTRKRLITGDSRIEVDFEYSDLRFQRNLYSAQLKGLGLSNRLTYQATLIREADDRKNLLETDIGDSERNLLAQLGDDVDSAFVASGQFVGPGNGDYVLSDSLGLTMFKYVGVGLGDYQAAFSFVGSGGGDYSYAGQGRYRFVGAGLGNFTPQRALPVAQSQNIAAMMIRFEPSPQFDISGELGLSHTDRNLWSSLDDGDNAGSAFELKSTLKPKSIRLKGRDLGNLQLRGLWREKDSRFFEISRDEEVEYNRRWDLPQGGSDRGESVREAGLSWAHSAGAQVRFDIGDFERKASLNSDRRSGEITINRPKTPKVTYRHERITRQDHLAAVQGEWTRQLARASYQLWRLQPTLRYESEDKLDRSPSDSLRTGFAFEELRSGLSFRIAKPLVVGFEHTVRDDQQVGAGSLLDFSRANGNHFSFALSRWRNLQLDFTWTNRSRSFTDPGQPDKKTRLADLNASYAPWKRALQTDVRVRVSTSQISRTEQFYFKVDDGTGNFRFDSELNEYIPDIFGDFVLRTLATGEFEPVNSFLLNAKLNIKPNLIFGKLKQKTPLQEGLSSIAMSTFFSFDEKSQRQNPWEVTLAGAGVFPDDETVFGRFLIRQDLLFFENIPTRSMRVRYSESLEKNNRLAGGGQKARRQEYSLRLRSRVSKRFSGEILLTEERVERSFEAALRVDRRILARGGHIRVSYRPQAKLEIAANLIGQFDRDREHEPATKTSLLGLRPSFSYALRSRGRLRGEVEFSNMTASPSGRVIPYEMADGRQSGKNYHWQLGLDYRVSTRITVLVSYLGRKQPITSELQHLGKAEVKAFF